MIMSNPVFTFRDELMELVKQDKGNSKHEVVYKSICDAFDVTDISKVKDSKLENELLCFVKAETIDKQLLHLKRMVAICNTVKDSSITECVDVLFDDDEHIIYKIISDIYFTVDLKSPLRCGIVRLISTLSGKRTEVIKDALIEKLKTIINGSQERTVKQINIRGNRIVGCFENFPIGLQVLCFCQNDIVSCLHRSLSVCAQELSNNDLSPSVRAEVFQCIHNYVKLAVLVLQNFREAMTVPVVDAVQSVLQLQGLPLDTANNCGLFVCLYVKQNCKTADEYVNLFNEYSAFDNKSLIICICSGLFNSLSSEELVATDYRLLHLIANTLIDISNRYSTDCTIVLSLARVFLVLSRRLITIPVVYVDLPYLSDFLLTFVWVHLDHYMDSVCHISTTILNNIVGAASALNSISSHEKNNMVNVVLERTVATPVWKRAKHIALQSLSEKLGSSVIISSEEDLIKSLLKSLQQPCAPSYMIDSIDKLMFQHLNEVGIEAWSEVWIHPLLDALITNNGRNHGLEKLLTKAIRTSPNIAYRLLRENEFSGHWLVSLSILHACRKLGIEDSDFSVERGLVNYSFFEDAICHKDDEVRLACFAVFIESRKSTAWFTKKELEIIRLFFKYNINDFSSATNHQKLGYINKFLSRFVDSLQALEKYMIQNKEEEYSSDISSLLMEYKIFPEWVVSFCFDNLFPGANLGRRSTALSILSKVHDFGVWPASANTVPNADILRFCLTDSYENNKILAKKLLTLMPPEIHRFHEREIVQLIFETSIKLGSSFRPPDSITGAYLMSTLMAYPSTYHVVADITNQTFDDRVPSDGVRIAITAVIDKLRNELDVACKNLLAASATGPLHGQLLIIRHLLEDLNLNEICSPEWKKLISELLSLCFECSAAVSSVVSSNSPEGHLPPSVLIDEQELTSSDLGSGSEEKVNVTAQMVLLCSWRTIKEVSLVLGHLAKHAPISSTCSQGLISEEQLISIGDHLTMLLAEIKHRGAFEQAYIGFCKLASRLWCFPDGNLHKLPYKWLQETVEEIASDSKISATRRSAGIPYIIQALVCTEIGVGDGSCFSMCISRLLELSSSKEHSADTRIHSLNILRALFRNAVLREAVSPYVQNAFIVAISGFRSSSWGERNSSTLLFSAMMTRVFGVKRMKGYDLSWKNKMTGRIFFQRYPEMYNFLLDQLLVSKAKESSSRGDMSPTLYPVLLLLSRLYPSSLEGTDSNLKLSELLDPLLDCSGVSVMKTRLLTARAVIPLISPDKYIEHLDRLFHLISTSREENLVHGLISQVEELLKCEQLIENVDRDKLQAKVDECLSKLVDLVKSDRHSCIVCIVFVSVLNAFHSMFYDSSYKNAWEQLSVYLEEILMLNRNDRVACQIGLSQYRSNIVEFLLKLKIFSDCDSSDVCDLMDRLRSSVVSNEESDSIFDVIFYLIVEENQENNFVVEDEEDFINLCKNFKRLKRDRKIKLKEYILNSDVVIHMIINELLLVDSNTGKDRLLDIISLAPNAAIHLLERENGLNSIVKSSGIDINNGGDDDDEIFDSSKMFVLKLLLRIPYDQVILKYSITEEDRILMCKVLVKYIYSNNFQIDSSVRCMIANWYSKAFWHVIKFTNLSPDIRLSLWSYLVVLCLDEECYNLHFFPSDYCHEKALEKILTSFSLLENSTTVLLFGFFAWIIGPLDFNKDFTDELYELNGKPMEKDEIESCYEEITLSKTCSKFLHNILKKFKKELPLHSETSSKLLKWIAKHCNLPQLENAKTIADLGTIFQKCVTEKHGKTTYQYCDFLKCGYKTLKSIQIKCDCICYVEACCNGRPVV